MRGVDGLAHGLENPFALRLGRRLRRCPEAGPAFAAFAPAWLIAR
ncbi:hypothetical protein LTSEMON_2923 [Salmonella enterica subsp. enterica serovar Montevideo str. S5-403]|uniref:Uncharacterized protein n=1 Tax=Salmonella enterica subsp. enterica serovar Montevideo str. S5-403 TaxID=913242 RepID=G5Q4D1_SALMO|nr:hypothetical protein LTSEMON_2923 [Salmonella enterica subsp. enterica serovar Montevideo str. S5-403]